MSLPSTPRMASFECATPGTGGRSAMSAAKNCSNPSSAAAMKSSRASIGSSGDTGAGAASPSMSCAAIALTIRGSERGSVRNSYSGCPRRPGKLTDVMVCGLVISPPVRRFVERTIRRYGSALGTDAPERAPGEHLAPLARAEVAPGDEAGVALPRLGTDVPAHPAPDVGDGEEVPAVGRESRRHEGVAFNGQRRADRALLGDVPEQDRPVGSAR